MGVEVEQVSVEMRKNGFGAFADPVLLMEDLGRLLDGSRMNLVLLLLRERSRLSKQIPLSLLPSPQRINKRPIAIKHKPLNTLKPIHFFLLLNAF